MLYLADQQPTDLLDIGILGNYNSSSTEKHTGLIRDASDGIWKLFTELTSEPTSVVDFTSVTYAPLKIGALTATTGTYSGSVSATGFTGSGASLTSIPNSALVNNTTTIGSTSTALGATSTSLAGLINVTSSGTITAGTFSGTGIVRNIYHGTTAATSGTSTIPETTTVPVSTNGTQIWSQIVTPVSTTSRFVISQTFFCDNNTNARNVAVAVFRGTTNIGTTMVNISVSGRTATLSVHILDSPATVSAITYSLRVGTNGGAGTWYLNQSASGTTFGSSGGSDWIIMEIQ
jgi:hypothetical protein